MYSFGFGRFCRRRFFPGLLSYFAADAKPFATSPMLSSPPRPDPRLWRSPRELFNPHMSGAPLVFQLFAKSTAFLVSSSR